MLMHKRPTKRSFRRPLVLRREKVCPVSGLFASAPQYAKIANAVRLRDVTGKSIQKETLP